MSFRPEIPVSPLQPALEDPAVEAAARIERDIRRFLHELAGLVDGTRRAVELGRMQLEDDGPKGLDSALASLETAQSGLDQLAELVISAQAGSSEVPVVPGLGSSLRENIWDAIELVRPAAASCDIAITVDLDASLARCPAMPLFPVVRNALRNAVEASRTSDLDRPTIDIRAHTEDDALVLTITDEGTGLARTLGERSPFDEGMTTKPEGMGIGLALCQEIVNALGGEVTLRNRDDGRSGCVFALRAPLGDGPNGTRREPEG